MRLCELPREVGGALPGRYCSCTHKTSSRSKTCDICVEQRCFYYFFKHKKRAARTTVGSALRALVAASPFPSVVLFLWFSSSHPTGCRNVATERFKNSILHSDSAALVAPHYCAASSRNVKMATDLGELLVPYMPTIRVPRTGDRVFKSECAFSFDSPVSGRLPPPHTPPHTPTHKHTVCVLQMDARELAFPVAIAR